jgi:hypothetical protein
MPHTKQNTHSYQNNVITSSPTYHNTTSTTHNHAITPYLELQHGWRGVQLWVHGLAVQDRRQRHEATYNKINAITGA